MNTTIKIVGLIIALFILAEGVVFAQLSWENKQLMFAPKIGDANVAGEFRFKNKGNERITIKSIKTSCGCTTADLDKKVYESGESGVITAKFDIRHRYGFQQKHIMVETDDSNEPITQLTIEADVVPLVQMEPVTVGWAVGAANETKIITLKPNPAIELKILNANSTNYSIFPQLETVVPGKEYILRITPKSTAEPARATIILETDYPRDRPREIDISVEIK